MVRATPLLMVGLLLQRSLGQIGATVREGHSLSLHSELRFPWLREFSNRNRRAFYYSRFTIYYLQKVHP